MVDYTRMERNKHKQRKIRKMKINFQVFDSLPSPGSLSDALADKLRMSRTSLAEVVIMMTWVMTVVMTIIMTVMMTAMMRMLSMAKSSSANIAVVLIAKEGK